MSRSPSLHAIHLVDQRDITDEMLSAFRDHAQLLRIELGSARISDEGLKHFSNSRELVHLHLSGTRVTGKSLGQLPMLQHLALANTLANDATLEALATNEALN